MGSRLRGNDEVRERPAIAPFPPHSLGNPVGTILKDAP